jgi:hypothetical protein
VRGDPRTLSSRQDQASARQTDHAVSERQNSRICMPADGLHGGADSAQTGRYHRIKMNIAQR